MKSEEVKDVANYICQALGKTGINIGLCTNRLKHYTDNIPLDECKAIIQKAFNKHQEDPGEALDFITSVLVECGVENPDIWWKEDSSDGSTKETENLARKETQELLNQWRLFQG